MYFTDFLLQENYIEGACFHAKWLETKPLSNEGVDELNRRLNYRKKHLRQ